MEQYWILVIPLLGCLLSIPTVRAQTGVPSTTSSSTTTPQPPPPPPPPPGLQTRIVNGENATAYRSGRVEVSNDGGTTWGTICDDFFNKSAAIVVCRSFGFTDGEAIAKAYFGSGSGAVFLDDVECQGFETDLSQCRKSKWKDHDCDHTEDVGVYCYNSTDGVFKMQLTEGSTATTLNTIWGRLEVALGNMKWGSVCDDLFNENAAGISCKYFGYSYGQRLTEEGFRNGERTYMDEVNCRGGETSLLQCRHNSWRTHDCGREEDVGVVCFNTTVRLRSKSLTIRNVGAVELWKAGEGWMEVCDKGWTEDDAKVTCRELGFVDGMALHGSALAGNMWGSPWGKHPWSTGRTVSSYSSVNCTGSETRLADCPMVRSGRGCSTLSSASVICYNTTIDEVDNSTEVRLSDGDNWGRVEIYHLGLWGQVCSDQWSDREASVVCRMIGYKGGKAFGDTSRDNLPPWLTDITCVGNETNVLDCDTGEWGESVYTCTPAHVLCYNTNVTVSLDNPTAGYGRVDISYDGVNGTICNDGWSDEESSVVCQMVGYTDGRAMNVDVQPGSGPVWLSSVTCGFGDDSLFECDSKGWEKSSDQCADHQNDAGVRCYRNVRLTPGTHSVGVVQIYSRGRWATVCGRTGFNDNAAKVVCSELGFKNGQALPLGVFGRQRLDSVRPNITCSSNEKSLLDCDYDKSLTATCLPYSISYASVACYDTVVFGEEYKLEGGNIETDQASGRLRVFKHQTWGYVCDKYWDDNDANVTCKELGHKGGIAYRYAGNYPGPFFISEINCVGSESKLEDCPKGQELCTSLQAGGVLCYSGEAPRLQFSPKGGKHGRLEVIINGEAGRICGKLWDDNDATVACSQLGFNDGVALKYPKGRGSVYMTQLRCFGNEPSLFRCTNSGWKNVINDEPCVQDAGAFCFRDVRVTGGSVNQSMAMGRISMLIGSRWHMVCADSFDQVDADVACTSLGFSRSKILRTFRATYNPNYITNVECNGDESSLANCKYTKGQCPYSVGQAKVICFSDSQQAGTKYHIHNGFNGRVIVERYGLNGTICEEGWSDVDANILCKQSGYAGGVAYGTPRNSSFELVWYSEVNCTGSEASIVDCVKNDTVSRSCRNSATSAGVLCYKSTGIQVRLADGGKNFGRVEISYDGVWGTICDYVWSRYDARALCRQLGFVEGIAYAQSRYGRGSGPVYMDEMRCRINDKSIYTCPNRGWNNSAGYCHDHDNDAGVYCFPRVRLEPKPQFGGLEIWTGYSYGLVCSAGFTDTEAKVACRQMGYPDGKALCCSAFGDMGKSIAIGDLKCTGEEASVMDCSHTKTSQCSSNHYASVVCSNVTDTSNAYIVKLDNGTTGRVVLRHFSHDGLICPNGFDDNDAKVVCREIGMTNGGFSYKRINNNRRSFVKELRWMTNLNCTGEENLLETCPGITWNQINPCDRGSDAAAFCYRSPGRATRLEGRVEVNINGTWGSICGINVDDNVAGLICKDMNHPSGIAGKAGSRGKTVGPVWINQLDCVGNESSIFDCPLTGFGEDDDLCKSHLYDAVIQCHSTGTIPVRLSGDINGRTDYGRLEIKLNGTWASVCDNGFNDNSAEVACHQMGYNKGKRQCCSALGNLPRSMDPKVTRITCEGHEQMLANCTIAPTGECASYVSVACSTTELSEVLKISLPKNGFTGMVNVSRYGIWGAICGESWNDTEAISACRQLGYVGGVAIPGSAIPLGMPIIMGNVVCRDDDTNFNDCSRDDFDTHHGCAESRAGAAVLCSNSGEGVQYRMAPGSVGDKGIAQLNINGQWGYISRLEFDDKDASVFCRSIGMVAGQVLWRSPSSSSLRGNILASYVNCTGSEAAVHQCQVVWDPERNRYIPATFAVSVSCFRGVRIERGDSKTNGIVKVYNNGVWGAICSKDFDNRDATVICRELGMTGGLALCCNPYGFNFRRRIADLRCTGKENSIRECKFSSRQRTSLCYRQNYASVACYNDTLSNNYTISLSGGSRYTGQVALTFANVEGRVCSDNWDDPDAAVVCSTLGYSKGVAYSHYRSSFSYFDYTGPYWTSQVNCTGNETSLRDCPHIGWGNVTKCSSGHFGGALCFNNEGLFYRLSAGGDQWGRVEVAVDGQWGSLCDRYWDKREAKVFCKNLGFDDGDPFYGSYNDTATGPVWESNLRCDGGEKTLNQCPHEGWAVSTSRSCLDHTRDAGVFCYTKVKLSTGVGRSIQHGGVLWNQRGDWHYVCDTGFNDMSARVVCQSLGFKDGRSICCSAYGNTNSYNKDIITNMTLRCTGEEESISECMITEDCVSKMYASVVCSDNPQEFVNDNYTLTINTGEKNSGQLRVAHYGVQGRVCSRDWDDEDASVVCGARGYTGGMAYKHSYVGTYSTQRQLGPYWLSSFNCTGEEKDLMDCPHLDRTNLGNCSNKHTAAVLCYNDSGIEYRVAGTGLDFFGRAEIRIGGVWGTICDNYWDAKEANVFCRQLNFSDGVAISRARYGQGSGPIWLSHLQCTGNEKYFHECPHRGYKDLYSAPSFGWPFTLPCTSHKDDASVFCYKSARLNQRFGATKGGLEIFDDGKKVGVCDTGLDNTAATVACKSLGMNFTHGRAIGGSVFGNISGPIVFTSIKCKGTEKDIKDCTLSKEGTCTTGTYASVYCSKTPFNDTGFQIRLAADGLSKDYHGIVEVKKNGVWGRVCMQGWDDMDASVACRSLGFKGGVAYLHIVKNTNAILMRNFRCSGNETSLDKCPHHETADKQNCNYDSNDAGVICYNKTATCLGVISGRRIPVKAAPIEQMSSVKSLIDTALAGFRKELSAGRRAELTHLGVNCGRAWLGEQRLPGLILAGRGDSMPSASAGDLALRRGCHRCLVPGETGLPLSSPGVPTGGRLGTDQFGDTSAPGSQSGLPGKPVAAGSSRATRRPGAGSSRQGGSSSSSLASARQGRRLPPFPASTSLPLKSAYRSFEECYRCAAQQLKVAVHSAYLSALQGQLVAHSAGGADSSESVLARQLTDPSAPRHRPSPLASAYPLAPAKDVVKWAAPLQSKRSEASRGKGQACASASSQSSGQGKPARLPTDSCPRALLPPLHGGDLPAVGVHCLLPPSLSATAVPIPPGFLQSPFVGPNMARLLRQHGGDTRDYVNPNSAVSDRPIQITNFICYLSALTHVRLGKDRSGDQSVDRGRVEVYVSGPNEWGTVCDDYWDKTDATVVCRQLGFQHGRAINGSAYGKGTGRIWLDNVECIGNETSIGDCQSRGIGTHNCNHSEDASVECYNSTTPQTTSPVTTSPVTTVSTTTTMSTTTSPTSTTTPPTTTSPTTTPSTTTERVTSPVPPSSTSQPTTSASATSTSTTTTTPSMTTTTISTTSTSVSSSTTNTPTTETTTTPTTTLKTGTAATGGQQQKPSKNIVVAVVVPIVLLIIIITIIAVVLWRVRRHPKSHFAHERFHDDIIEQTHDGSIAMRNQLYDMNMSNGETADPMSDTTKYLAEDSEISIEGNGYAHFSKAPTHSEEDSGGFSNPLYAVMKDPTATSNPAELTLQADINTSNT
ncbi:LOW QUALITY PROTEIN: deleted in malignant brain tumors 1 protein-like [Haliotis rubra]|uniref:LOW QUALITY PROTEIN: deleted in malignant brain tumors 1 protein-like n=1 Tax=Haliotis rubra TaxID=36100 RepID=UPI001EE52386|nr:LOW QUALITY PROTEIN: deleted in malignant brain tumors 1 protein-like [Haliotis rubra]